MLTATLPFASTACTKYCRCVPLSGATADQLLGVVRRLREVDEVPGVAGRAVLVRDEHALDDTGADAVAIGDADRERDLAAPITCASSVEKTGGA